MFFASQLHGDFEVGPPPHSHSFSGRSPAAAMKGSVAGASGLDDGTEALARCFAEVRPPSQCGWRSEPGHLWWYLASLPGGGTAWLLYDYTTQLLLESAWKEGQRGVYYRMPRWWYYVDFVEWVQQRQSWSEHAQPRPVMRLPAEDGQPANWKSYLYEDCSQQ